MIPTKDQGLSTARIHVDAALMDALTEIATRAAATILAARADSGIRTKTDGSPVTTADEAAEAVILAGLAQVAPALTVVSEEQAAHQAPAVSSTSYALVDPLDGTKEFIAGLDEYTVNIAIVSGGVPVLGVVAAPALGLIWRGIIGGGAERIVVGGGHGQATAIRTRALPSTELVAAVSRSHLEARSQAFLAGLPRVTQLSCGSSLKFCRVAEGAADIYPRLAPTRDWDVAAGHAVLAAAGGSVLTPDGAPLRYGAPDFGIAGFIAWGDPAAPVQLGIKA
jgi:3'(2'), 5'-bisphosphate nucleotidase